MRRNADRCTSKLTSGSDGRPRLSAGRERTIQQRHVERVRVLDDHGYLCDKVALMSHIEAK